MVYIDWIFVLFTTFITTLFFLFCFSPWGIGFIRERLAKERKPFYYYYIFYVGIFHFLLCYGLAFLEGFLKVVNFKDGLFFGAFLYVFLILPIQFLSQRLNSTKIQLFWYDQLFWILDLSLACGILAGWKRNDHYLK